MRGGTSGWRVPFFFAQNRPRTFGACGRRGEPPFSIQISVEVQMRIGMPFWGLLRAGAVALLLLFLGVGTAAAHDGPAAEHTLVTASQGDPTQPLFTSAQDASVCQDGSMALAELRNAPHHPPGMMCLCGDDCLCAGNCGCVKVCAAHLLTALPAALDGLPPLPVIDGETLRIASDAMAGRTPAPLPRPPLSV